MCTSGVFICANQKVAEATPRKGERALCSVDRAVAWGCAACAVHRAQNDNLYKGAVSSRAAAQSADECELLVQDNQFNVYVQHCTQCM